MVAFRAFFSVATVVKASVGGSRRNCVKRGGGKSRMRFFFASR